MKSPRPRIRAGSPAARTRSRLALARKYGDVDAVPALERQLQVDMATDYIRELVDGWPPLTQEQKDILVGLFGSAAKPGTAGAKGRRW
jgi:hypothetical protein